MRILPNRLNVVVPAKRSHISSHLICGILIWVCTTRLIRTMKCATSELARTIEVEGFCSIDINQFNSFRPCASHYVMKTSSRTTVRGKFDVVGSHTDEQAWLVPHCTKCLNNQHGILIIFVDVLRLVYQMCSTKHQPYLYVWMWHVISTKGRTLERNKSIRQHF